MANESDVKRKKSQLFSHHTTLSSFFAYSYTHTDLLLLFSSSLLLQISCSYMYLYSLLCICCFISSSHLSLHRSFLLHLFDSTSSSFSRRFSFPSSERERISFRARVPFLFFSSSFPSATLQNYIAELHCRITLQNYIALLHSFSLSSSVNRLLSSPASLTRVTYTREENEEWRERKIVCSTQPSFVLPDVYLKRVR